ncbi:MAG: ABC transporter substrate-binding protein [Clostridia bacterium]
MKKIKLLFLAMLIATTLVACGDDSVDTAQNAGQNNNQQENLDILDDNIITDQKIVSLAPSITEILVEFGFKDNIVGADYYSISDFNLTDVQEFDMMALNAENIVTLKPDIIFLSDMSAGGGDDPLAVLSGMGIEIHSVATPQSIDEIYTYIEFIGDCMDTSSDNLVSNLKAEIEEFRTIGDTITDKKTVLFEISAVPYIYSFGEGVYMHEMIEIIGATNVLADQTGWLPVEEESAIKLNPDVIVTNVNYLDDSVAEILGRIGWENVTAVQNQDVYYIDNSASSYGNHNIIVAISELAKAIYPDFY